MTENNPRKRPDWDQYYLKIVKAVGERGTCDRGYAGSVITKNNRLLCTGYAGAPIGTAHCDDAGHEMHTVIHADGKETRHCIRTAHAEQNAIVTAARFGVALDGATLYCNMTPCYACAKMIINAGIKRVICEKDYHAGARSKSIFQEAGIEYLLVNPELELYKDM
jgi:dCMP deaminase